MLVDPIHIIYDSIVDCEQRLQSKLWCLFTFQSFSASVLLNNNWESLHSCLHTIQIKKSYWTVSSRMWQFHTLDCLHRCLSLRMGSSLFALMEEHFKGKGKKLLILSVWIRRFAPPPFFFVTIFTFPSPCI